MPAKVFRAFVGLDGGVCGEWSLFLEFEENENKECWVFCGCSGFEKSIGKGMGTDASLIPDDAPLPKLPLPPLQQTVDRYLDAVRPLVPPAAFERTRNIAKAFAAPAGPGPRLQRALEKRRECTANWAYEWWLADMYLNNPLPLPINSNPGMVFPPAVARTAEERARFTARMVLSAVRYQTDVLDK
ncbi:Choline O-acetyltransferase [Frankliniella fusca]|uniref:Choline O-acetyltransferase n=1 Tax=Frankliniella fusca TaxID=407009 RepID=A0AAE1HR64_9NEOP|nr:Choline O-acetyltransferase [Frankliniella fusca]